MATAPKITKEQYLEFRRQKKSKANIAAEVGVATNTLYNWLEQWGLLTPEDEQRELEAAVPTTATKLTLDDFTWIRPDYQRPLVRISKNALRISGYVTQYLNKGDTVEIGFGKGVIAIRNSSYGWRLTKDSNRPSCSSVVIPSKRVAAIFAEHGYQSGTTFDAEWNDNLNVILATPEGGR